MLKSSKINKKTSFYLRNLSNLVDGFPENVSNVLKSSYMARCDILEGSSINKTDDYLTITCPRCNIDISETAKFALIPKQCSRFTKTLRKRIENGSCLTNYQKRYAKDMPVISHDGQVAFNITCNICKKSIKKVMSKWKTSFKRKAAEEPEIIQTVQVQPKKKKKKGDKFSGLNKDAIQSVQNRNSPLGQINKKVQKVPQFSGLNTDAVKLVQNRNSSPRKVPEKVNQSQRNAPVIVSNIKSRKKHLKNNNTKEMMKNKNKLGQILGISLTNNSAKSADLNNFFNSF